MKPTRQVTGIRLDQLRGQITVFQPLWGTNKKHVCVMIAPHSQSARVRTNPVQISWRPPGQQPQLKLFLLFSLTTWRHFGNFLLRFNYICVPLVGSRAGHALLKVIILPDFRRKLKIKFYSQCIKLKFWEISLPSFIFNMSGYTFFIEIGFE